MDDLCRPFRVQLAVRKPRSTLRATTRVPKGLWEHVSGLKVQSIPFCNVLCVGLLDTEENLSYLSQFLYLTDLAFLGVYLA